MDVDRAVFDIDVIAPDVVEQLLARVDASGIGHQETQQPEFGRGQGDPPARNARFVADRVQLDRTSTQRALDKLWGAAAQYRLHARQQFLRAEGLDDVIVGAAFQPGNTICFLATCGQQDDRHAARSSFVAELANQRQPGLTGQHPVDQRNVGQCFTQHRFGLFGGVGTDRLVAAADEREAQKLLNAFVVLDDEHHWQAGNRGVHAFSAFLAALPVCRTSMPLTV
ncbi:MAG: hypothetical protein AW09_003720 [Candidatus Accumulibacter phosphatis]|uniref:Uncharacterized protein n=1 Tax=Candidatus Accumulibacter phosphatis TaxID=327160 RepID=A0A080LS67_9PROT|nr:MAG: hypothetical protein AW09_003720 [Candidatus Accumulibacter phosphatis]